MLGGCYGIVTHGDRRTGYGEPGRSANDVRSFTDPGNGGLTPAGWGAVASRFNMEARMLEQRSAGFGNARSAG